MLAEERRFRIQEILTQKSTVSISELMEVFGTSDMTIRRDLDELASRGVCQRIHGGAISLRVMEYPHDAYPHFSQREMSQVQEKTAIAQEAVRRVATGEVIAIDTGTSAAYLAHALRSLNSITVITNSLGVLAQLFDVTSIALISPGGALSIERAGGSGGDLAFVGPIAVQTLRGFRPNKAFISASGISVVDGISNAGLFQAEIKRTLIEIAEEVILIADHTKFNRVGGILVAGMENFHTVITDTRAPKKDVACLCDMGIEVIQVEPVPEPLVLRSPFLPPLNSLADLPGYE